MLKRILKRTLLVVILLAVGGFIAFLYFIPRREDALERSPLALPVSSSQPLSDRVARRRIAQRSRALTRPGRRGDRGRGVAPGQPPMVE